MKTCPECDAALPDTLRRDAKFCTARCRMKATGRRRTQRANLARLIAEAYPMV